MRKILMAVMVFVLMGAVVAPVQAQNLTRSQEQAVRSAVRYLQTMPFSRQGLIDQLSSEYGEKFSVRDVTIAVNYMNVDWNQQAVRDAKRYLKTMPFSCQGLIDQLSSEYGGKYTLSQARHGAQSTGICGQSNVRQREYPAISVNIPEGTSPTVQWVCNVDLIMADIMELIDRPVSHPPRCPSTDKEKEQ